MRDRKNKSWAAQVKVPAEPEKPNIAATTPIIRNADDHAGI
jgi:hypothetical protein